MAELMTEQEYEDRQRRLAADIEDARETLARAKYHFDKLCRESQYLRLYWQEQQRAAKKG